MSWTMIDTMVSNPSARIADMGDQKKRHLLALLPRWAPLCAYPYENKGDALRLGRKTRFSFC
jgi:hypothetical protein